MSATEYEKGIIEAITNQSPIKIDTISHLEDIGTYPFSKDNFNEINSALQSGQYSNLPKPDIGEKSFDDITIFRFKDGKENTYYAIIYDSWALEQYPELLKIYMV